MIHLKYQKVVTTTDKNSKSKAEHSIDTTSIIDNVFD